MFILLHSLFYPFFIYPLFFVVFIFYIVLIVDIILHFLLFEMFLVVDEVGSTSNLVKNVGGYLRFVNLLPINFDVAIGKFVNDGLLLGCEFGFGFYGFEHVCGVAIFIDSRNKSKPDTFFFVKFFLSHQQSK